MTDTPNLALPYILASQAQKHVTHNEAIRALDCLVQLSVASRVLASPPASPVEGSRYIVATGASGDWTGQSNKIAAYQDAAWTFYTPQDGWLAWVASENILVVYEAASWSALPGGSGGGGVTDHGMLTGLADDDHLQYHTDARGDVRYTLVDPETLGINATADTTNRLAVSSAASLFNHDGSGHQLKVNKNSAADTASFLFQIGFSGRAEIGLTGDDDFHFKVSSDGSSWHDGIKIDRTTGRVDFPNTGSFPNSRNRTINPCGAIAQSGFAAAADGTYSGFDQWYVLTQAGTVLASQLADVEDGTPTMMRLTQSQATAQRFGLAQPFESSFVKDLRSKTVTLAARVRMSVSTTLRYAIIEWAGAADTITKDVVADWSKATLTAGQFFAASNLTIAATGSIALTSGTLANISLSAPISSSMNNLIVFFWTDTAQAQTTTLDLGNVFFGQGPAAPAIFDPPAPDADLRSCRRYYAQSYQSGTAPGTATNTGLVDYVVPAAGTAGYAMPVYFPVPMRVAPSVTAYDPTGAAGVVYKGGNGKTASIPTITSTSCNIGTSSNTSSAELAFHYSADARL